MHVEIYSPSWATFKKYTLFTVNVVPSNPEFASVEVLSCSIKLNSSTVALFRHQKQTIDIKLELCIK